MVELTALRDWLDFAPTDTDEDSLLLELEARAVTIIERQTGYHYSTSDEYTEVVTGDGTPTLYLSRNPSAVPTEVLEHAAIGDAGTEIETAASDGWILRGGRLLRKAGAIWTKGLEYSVTYPAGYEVGTEPGDVAQAVLEITGILYRGRGKEGFANETTGPLYSYTKHDEAIKDVLARLPYRPVLA